MKNTLKKILALIMSVLTIAAIPLSAFATYYENPEDRISDPYGSTFPYFEEPLFPIEMYTEKHGYHELVKDGVTYIYEGGHYNPNDGSFSDKNEYCRNWIISTENPDWLYYEMPDGTVALKWNYHQPDYECGTKELVVPSTIEGKSVSVIGEYGFHLCGAESIRIPEGVKSIRAVAFDFKVKRVFLPSSLEEIALYFTIENVQESVYYAGTAEQWANIVVYNVSGNTVLRQYIREYVDWDTYGYCGPIKLSDNFEIHNAMCNGYYETRNFDWKTYSSIRNSKGFAPVSASFCFNANPDDYEYWENELSFFEKISNGISNIIAAIIEFFKNSFSWN